MKYPECCYRLWNDFRDRDGYVGGFALERGTSYGLDIVSITVGTLAELAKENKEMFIFHQGFTGNLNIGVGNNSSEPKQFSNKKGEPSGEFFLRVAKERKYIK